MANNDETKYEYHERVAILLGEIDNPTPEQMKVVEQIAKWEIEERAKHESANKR